MPEKRKQHFLKAKEAKALLQTAERRLGVDLTRLLGGAITVEDLKTETVELIILNGKPALFKTQENLYPTLTFEEYFRMAPKAVVDMGAIPFVCKGANVMAPGIRKIEGQFEKGHYVYVIDERYGKPLSVGEALHSADEMRNTKQGVVIKNLHYVGDKTWNIIKKLDF